jgi:choloylglycine hydrolase
VIGVLLVVVLSSGLLSSASACTIFSVSAGESILVGNNEDWFHTNFSVRFYPSGVGRHGYAAFIHSENSIDIRAGMNDHGVFIDGASVPPSQVAIDPEKPFLNRNLLKYVLETCESVNETIEKLSYFNYAETWSWQILVADAHGDSVVMVAGPDETVWFIRGNETYQLITNGNIAIPELGQSESSEQRYNAAQALLEQVDGSINVSYCRAVLDAAHSPGTAFSSVYDLVNRDIYVYFNHDYTKEVVFNLDEELEKGQHTYELEFLFESLTTSTIDTGSTASTTDTTTSAASDLSLAITVSFAIVFSSVIVVLVLTRKTQES